MNELISTIGLGVSIAICLMALAGVAWLVAIVASIASRAPLPKTGLRRTERAVIGSSFIFVLCVVATLFAVTARSKAREAAKAAAAKPVQASRGTCASLRVGMKAAEVKRAMGEPDDVRSEEDVRGPEAQAWIYRASRCSVHILSGRIDFID
ncbi:MAG: hypothetical protein HYU52_15300 [Acidobacteria bacterium]|nr:hypothetical protein [Acidobacteriota bacterium]